MKTNYFFMAVVLLIIFGCQEDDKSTGTKDDLTIEREEEYEGTDVDEVHPIP